jgi:hypothetical protein
MRTTLVLLTALALACSPAARDRDDDTGSEPDASNSDSDTGTADTDTGPPVTVFPNGIELDWAFSIGGVGSDIAALTVPLADGGMIIGGWIEYAVTFGKGEATETTLDCAGDTGGFIARYAGDGSFVWAKHFIGEAHSYNYAAPAFEDADGSIIVCGSHGPNAVFGAGEPNETVLPAADTEAFAAKYAADGSLIWARNVGGIGLGVIGAQCADVPGPGFLISGQFIGTQTFGEGGPNETQISAGLDDAVGLYVAKLSDESDLEWIRNTSGIVGIVTNVGQDGAFSYFGGIEAPTTFGKGEPHETTVVPQGHVDGFVARYDADGGFEKVLRIGGSNDSGNDEWVMNAESAGDGAMMVNGEYVGSATIASGDEVLATLDANYDFWPGKTWGIYLARLGEGGDVEWARTVVACSENCRAFMTVIPEDGSILLTGRYSSEAVFDPRGPRETMIEAVQQPGCPYAVDSFIALYNSSGSLVWFRREGGPAIEEAMLSTRLADGSLLVSGMFSDQGASCEATETVIGLGDPKEQTFTSAGWSDLFYARFVAK